MSVRLSLVCVYLCAAVLLAADVFAQRWIGAYIVWRSMARELLRLITISLYCASVFGWVCLWALRSLLVHLRGEKVFVKENVRLLNIISLCCLGAAAVCLVSASYYLPFLLLALAAGFMALIVRTVRDVFERAIGMKAELDLTI